MILYTSYFISPDPVRASEIDTAFLKNTVDVQIRQIELYVEEKCDVDHPKIIKHHGRPMFSEMIKHANQNHPGEIIIIANVDIYFDGTLSVLLNYDFSNKLLALTRWDVDADGNSTLWNRGDSQDCWIFRSPLKDFNSDFYQGIPGVDNRIAYEASQAGIEVKNPSLTVKCHHYHMSTIRRYTGEAYGGSLLTLDPCEL